jgi:nucleoside-diphosphate-sugar epimerase
MHSGMRIAVAGSTGRVGRHIVDVLETEGHEIVPISRSHGVDLVSAVGLADALAGVDGIVDAATQSSPEEQPATEFFTTATRNLHEAGDRAGVTRLLVVSIIGCDRFQGG